jgi:eukaryotic-like serine/threonine-protein kinase
MLTLARSSPYRAWKCGGPWSSQNMKIAIPRKRLISGNDHPAHEEGPNPRAPRGVCVIVSTRTGSRNAGGIGLGLIRYNGSRARRGPAMSIGASALRRTSMRLVASGMLRRWKRADPERITVGDRYTVERELGRGGMATVYLARDRKHDRPVAIKIMRPEIVGDQGAQRFLLEIQILARLQHPNILALLDSGEAVVGRKSQVVSDEPTTYDLRPTTLPYYVMPYVEGETLRQRLTREGPLPVTEALRLVREIGEALHYAHGQGLIHRDVKPENVLLSQGHALVADFGIARAAGVAGGGGQQLTQPGLGLGTPAYMSPEQAEGDRGVDARADQYSLACVLYELLAGQPPFTGPTVAAVLSRQLLDPVPPITTLRAGVPGPVRRAIERALAKAPADRFETVLEFLAAMEAPEAPAAPPRKSIVVLPFANLSPDPENAYFADGLMEEVIADLSRVGALTVISRTSSVKLRDTGWDLRRIGRELNVRYALEGSVRRAGAALRITAQLIDTESDAHLWGEKYSGTVEDVFDLQERLSRRIVEALEITLSPPEDREIAERPIADIRAFEYYQRARQEYYRYSSEGMAAARALAEHGLAVVGPNEALYGMLGTVYAWSPTVLLGGDEETTLREAETCARRAFELNPGSAQGLSIMGQIAYRRGQPGEAVRLLAQACAADPNNPDAMHQLAGAHLLGGRIGPMREVLTRLVELDPLTASNHCLLGLSWSLGGDAPGGVPSHMRAIELDPRSTICRVCAGVALTLAGQREDAAEQFEWLERQPQEDSLAALARRFRHGLAGDRAAVLYPPGAAERAMAESDEYWAYLMAGAYALVGETDQALGWLEHAVTVRGWIDYEYFTRHDRFLESLRPTPQFQELMASARERYQRFTDDGTPTRVVSAAARSTS